MEANPPLKTPDNKFTVVAGLSRNTWEAQKPLVFGKDFFALQLEFAKEMAEKNGAPLIDVINSCTSTLSTNLRHMDVVSMKEGYTTEDLLSLAYGTYLNDEEEAAELVPYHKEGGTRFGCFYYDIDIREPQDILRVHFVNAEFGQAGPLDKVNVEKRKSEIQDLLKDIKANHPTVTQVAGLSWLYNYPAYKRLFPESYISSLKPDERKTQWARGTTVWGQFLDNQFKVKKELAEELLIRARALPADRPLADLFVGDSKIMPPLAARCSIEDFYKMYGVQ